MVSVLSLALSLSLHFCPPIVALYLDTSPSCFSQMQGERAKAVRSEAKETNKNEVVFESFPSKREIKQIKKEFKKQRKEFMEKGTDPVSNPDGFDELDQFGLPLEVENPLTRMCRAECLLALHLLQSGEMSVDFVDDEKLGVLRNAYE